LDLQDDVENVGGHELQEQLGESVHQGVDSEGAAGIPLNIFAWHLPASLHSESPQFIPDNGVQSARSAVVDWIISGTEKIKI
jgi:hypothetical protein